MRNLFSSGKRGSPYNCPINLDFLVKRTDEVDIICRDVYNEGVVRRFLANEQIL